MTAATSRVDVEEVVLDVFSDLDMFETICSSLGSFSCLSLACVCKAFSNDAWAHVLRILARVQGSCEREREGRMQFKTLLMPERVLHIRSLAFGLGVNANGKNLLGTLALLSEIYPQLRGAGDETDESNEDDDIDIDVGAVKPARTSSDTMIASQEEEDEEDEEEEVDDDDDDDDDDD